MTNKKDTAPKPVPFLVAQQGWINRIEQNLEALKQPMNQGDAKKAEIRQNLKDTLKEAIENTQNQLLLANAGKASIIKADSVGWTTANTDYDKEEILAKFPQGAIVNELCREILKEQETVAADEGMPTSQEHILKAQADSIDTSKDKIELVGVEDSSGTTAKLVIDKKTGDTEVFEKDKKTGVFKKVGNTISGFWQNTKDFCVNIWNWCASQCKRFFNWICSIFKSPDDADVIVKQAA